MNCEPEGKAPEVPDWGMRSIERLRGMLACSLFACVIAGCFGHNGDTVQWASIVTGSWIGGILVR